MVKGTFTKQIVSQSMRFGGQCRTYYCYYYYYYYYYLMQLSFHSVAVVLTLVQTKLIWINTHKWNKTKTQYKQFLLTTNLTHFFISYLLHLSTCFEHHSAHHQRSNCLNTLSGMISVCKWLLCVPYRHTKQSHRLIIPDDVLIQFDLLMMSTMMLETHEEV